MKLHLLGSALPRNVGLANLNLISQAHVGNEHRVINTTRRPTRVVISDEPSRVNISTRASVSATRSAHQSQNVSIHVDPHCGYPISTLTMGYSHLDRESIKPSASAKPNTPIIQHSDAHDPQLDDRDISRRLVINGSVPIRGSIYGLTEKVYRNKKAWYFGSSSSKFDSVDREAVFAMDGEISFLNVKLAAVAERERKRDEEITTANEVENKSSDGSDQEDDKNNKSNKESAGDEDGNVEKYCVGNSLGRFGRNMQEERVNWGLVEFRTSRKNKKEKHRKRLDWWVLLDDGKNVKEEKRRPAREWWKACKGGGVMEKVEMVGVVEVMVVAVVVNKQVVEEVEMVVVAMEEEMELVVAVMEEVERVVVAVVNKLEVEEPMVK
ncbi:hypothetical protein H5410_055789, partial [Solanum commersonii]